jgi:hypothetical protein
MENAEGYYFSGTGNSLVQAKLVAERLGGGLIPIASMIDRERIEPAADVVGIVFPVYYAVAPNIDRRFAEKLSGGSNPVSWCCVPSASLRCWQIAGSPLDVLAIQRRPAPAPSARARQQC